MIALVKYAQKRLSMNQSNKSYKHSSFDLSHGHFVIQCLTFFNTIWMKTVFRKNEKDAAIVYYQSAK